MVARPWQYWTPLWNPWNFSFCFQREANNNTAICCCPMSLTCPSWFLLHFVFFSASASERCGLFLFCCLSWFGKCTCRLQGLVPGVSESDEHVWRGSDDDALSRTGAAQLTLDGRSLRGFAVPHPTWSIFHVQVCPSLCLCDPNKDAAWSHAAVLRVQSRGGPVQDDNHKDNKDNDSDSFPLSAALPEIPQSAQRIASASQPHRGISQNTDAPSTLDATWEAKQFRMQSKMRKSHCSNRTVHTVGNKQQNATSIRLDPVFIYSRNASRVASSVDGAWPLCNWRVSSMQWIQSILFPGSWRRIQELTGITLILAPKGPWDWQALWSFSPEAEKRSYKSGWQNLFHRFFSTEGLVKGSQTQLRNWTQGEVSSGGGGGFPSSWIFPEDDNACEHKMMVSGMTRDEKRHGVFMFQCSKTSKLLPFGREACWHLFGEATADQLIERVRFMLWRSSSSLFPPNPLRCRCGLVAHKHPSARRP